MKIIDSNEITNILILLEKIKDGKPFQRADLILAIDDLHVIWHIMANQNIAFEFGAEAEIIYQDYPQR